MPPWPYWAEQGRFRLGSGAGKGRRSKRGEQGQVGDQDLDLDPMGRNANDA